MEHPKMSVVRHGIIRNQADFLSLDIADWRRVSQWRNTQHAIDCVTPIFINRFTYMVIATDLFEYPKRDDFPGWSHVGSHEQMGKLYWNHFCYDFPDSQLQFHDSPDFSGTIVHTDGRTFDFYGDIGYVSPVALKDLQAVLFDIWITVADEYTQVILERIKPSQDETCQQIACFLNNAGVTFHNIDNDIFIEEKEGNLFLGTIASLASASEEQIKSLIDLVRGGYQVAKLCLKCNSAVPYVGDVVCINCKKANKRG